MLSKDWEKKSAYCLIPGALYQAAGTEMVAITKNILFAEGDFFILKDRHECGCDLHGVSIDELFEIDTNQVLKSPTYALGEEFSEVPVGSLLFGEVFECDGERYVVVDDSGFSKSKAIKLGDCTLKTHKFSNKTKVKEMTWEPCRFATFVVGAPKEIEIVKGEETQRVKVVEVDYTDPYNAYLVDLDGVSIWVPTKFFSNETGWVGYELTEN